MDSDKVTTQSAGSCDVLETGSSDAGAGSWFGNSLKDLSSLGRSLKECIPPAIDGIADAIHRGAMSVAAEFSQMELDAESDAREGREERERDDGENCGGCVDEENVGALPLPWETRMEGAESAEDEELKNKILALSLEESNFKCPFLPNDDDFVDSDSYLDVARVKLIRRLFDVDENLGKTHAKLSGRSDIKEATFWKNYFHHCEKIKAEHELGAELIDTPTECNTDGSSRPSTPPVEDGILEQEGDALISPPKVKSVGDLVLVGCEVDDLDDIADDIARDTSN